MTRYTVDELDERLCKLLKSAEEISPCADVNVALKVADALEAKGYLFQLKDMCPKSMSDSLWRAVFSINDAEFTAESSWPAIAVCEAAATALDNNGSLLN
jgi:hypothetical protein